MFCSKFDTPPKLWRCSVASGTEHRSDAVVETHRKADLYSMHPQVRLGTREKYDVIVVLAEVRFECVRERDQPVLLRLTRVSFLRTCAFSCSYIFQLLFTMATAFDKKTSTYL